MNFKVQKITGPGVRMGPGRIYYYYISDGKNTYLSRYLTIDSCCTESFWFRTKKEAEAVLVKYMANLSLKTQLREIYDRLGDLLGRM